MSKDVRLEIKSCVGLGDLVLVYSQTEQIKHLYSEIAICPEYDLLKSCRLGSKESYEFTKEVAQILFSGPPYVLLNSSNRPLINPDQLSNVLGLKNKYINLSDKFCLPNIDIGVEDYVVINTKIRQIPQEVFDTIKNSFFDILKKTKKRIVIMGERNMGVNKEANSNTCIYTIYNDLKKALNDIDHIDITKDVLLDYPDINRLKNDMTIVRDSRCSICFGDSGIVILTAAIASCTIGYKVDLLQYVTDFYNGITNGKITNNFKEFTEVLCQKIL